MQLCERKIFSKYYGGLSNYVKKHTHYFFDDIINIKDFDLNNIEINENSYKNLLFYYIGYVREKDLKYVKVNSVNTLYLFSAK